MARVAIAGSTGSIGRQTLDVIRLSRSSSDHRVVALSANSSADELIEQIREFEPELVAIADAKARKQVEREISGSKLRTQVAGESS
ncbi:MAG: 1-deoxy-D-xylulose-5-phosphate reductoisomerase, partial [Actinomycetota bacterium]